MNWSDIYRRGAPGAPAGKARKQSGRGAMKKLAYGLVLTLALMVAASMLSGMLKGKSKSGGGTAAPGGKDATTKAVEPAAGASEPTAKTADPAAQTGKQSEQAESGGGATATPEAAATGAASSETEGADTGYLARKTDKESTKLPSTSSMLIKVGIALAVVIALMMGARALYRRLSGDKAPDEDSGVMKVVSYTGLGHNSGVYALRLGDRVLLVGASEKGLALLGEVPGEEVPEIEEAREAPAPSRFQKLLESGGDSTKGESRSIGGELNGWLDTLRWRTARR